MLLSAYIVFMPFSKLLLNTLFSSKRYEVNDVSNVVALDNVAPFYFQRSNATLKALKIVFYMKPVSHMK